MSTSGCNSSRSHTSPESHISPRTSLLGSTVSCIEISSEGRSEEWSLRANAASRASDLTYHTSSSLAVHTSKMGMTPSVLGGLRRSSAPLTSPPPVPSVISNLPPSYQTNAAIQKGLGDPRRGSSAGVTRLLPIPPIPPIPTPPTSLPSRPSSIAPSRMTALPSYRESPSPRPDTRMSHEHPPLPPPPQYTESRRSMTQNSSQAQESTPDETTLPSPHTPSPREPDIARASIQTLSHVSFQQHPFAMNAPVLFRASSTPSSIHAFPFVLQPPSPGVENSSRHGSEGPERQRFRWTSRTCFLLGFGKRWTQMISRVGKFTIVYTLL